MAFTYNYSKTKELFRNVFSCYEGSTVVALKTSVWQIEQGLRAFNYVNAGLNKQ